jgi:uncharacterized protein GlcG (DUF336 family)
MGEERPMVMDALINIADQKLLLVPCGTSVRDKNNQTIGSVGIAGDLSDEDEHCTVHRNSGCWANRRYRKIIF